MLRAPPTPPAEAWWASYTVGSMPAWVNAMPSVGPAMPPPAIMPVRIVLDVVAIGGSSEPVSPSLVVTIKLDERKLVKKMLNSQSVVGVGLRSPLALTVLGVLEYRPAHPYRIQQVIREWGKDRVINVGQRASLYRVIERLLAADLIQVRETQRDRLYPERTVYEVTDAGRQASRQWLLEMLRTPRQEFPEFPAALSNLLLLPPAEIAEALDERVRALATALAELDAGLAAEAASGLPRIAELEDEYRRVVIKAELDWVTGVAADLRRGRMKWSPEALSALADARAVDAPAG
jgi:DNA-binding PadR family transcriptional regulator